MHRRHAVDAELGQRPAGALERLLAAGAGHDELGDERVECLRNGLPGGVAGIKANTGAGRLPQAGDGAGSRQETAPGVLGVDAELDRVAAGLRIGVAESLAVGDPEHLPHQVGRR